ncbi:M13 family metallopeptidase [Thalassotalea euphylliae]|uniref:M13 family metallopeptidase n=1 Tax=Thalassotalea euphylliae TaxID=1655234 RepID=UPI00363E7E72
MKYSLYAAICTSLLLSACQSTTETSQLDAQREKSTANTNMQKTKLASGIDVSNMDLTVRPQDNFYRYVNGGWLKTNEIPSDKTTIGSFYDLRDDADRQVRAIIEELAETPNLIVGSDEQKVADLFRSFMDTKTRDQLGITPIKPILAEIETINTKSELMAFFGKYQSIGITSPMYLYISVDAKDSSRYATHVWQGGLGLPDKDYYLNQDKRFVDIRARYLAHIEKMFSLVGIESGKKAAKNILAIETAMADKHWTRVESRDSAKRYNKFKVANLPVLSAGIDWKSYLTAQGVEQQSDLIVNQPDFVEALGKVVADTPLTQWKQYITFHTLSAYSSYLTSELDAENFAFFSKQLNGLQEQRPQWKRGVNIVNSHLGEVIGKVYVARYFKPEAKARMRELVENLRNAYGHSIDELEWMSADTKKAAHVKLAAFTPKIGYPDKWEDYSSLDINRNDLVGNLIRSGKVAHQKEVAKLGGPIRKWEWGMTPQTVNAYYNPTVNEIVFPAAILQPPFFNMAADDAVNYGGIGAVIGHEMGHGFDDQGSRYDADGNLRNWWTEQDLAEFKKRAANLVAQYDNYKVFDDLSVNGQLTLGENIGDLSGLTIAYKAYKASLNGKEAPVIEGLTGDQRFFIGFAQIWRAKYVEKALRNRVATDPHSPSEFRAIGSLSNMDEFYDAFDVKEGDKMYLPPEQRVKIW